MIILELNLKTMFLISFIHHIQYVSLYLSQLNLFKLPSEI